jgi:bifunctional DNA-binding transcriptional regulator/antitoxin component of YhaV-PrlF toxin-antitoxin module
MGVVRLKVSEDGQLSLPDDLRKALDVEQGGELLATIEDHELRLRNVDAAIRRAQETLRRAAGDRPGMSVDDFLAWRRSMWGEED